ncbi:MAG: hypothetical protein GBAus27B_000193 [Mycoplasmataceae bacterium]|nr:MAG: hypothetical protein GBAus27B_000193 [Mycoplasmataceae bacterium]
MNNGTWLICSLLAVGIGIMTQQTIENLINSLLVLSPFDIKTVS